MNKFQAIRMMLFGEGISGRELIYFHIRKLGRLFIRSRIQTHFDHEMTSGLPRVGHLIAVIAL